MNREGFVIGLTLYLSTLFKSSTLLLGEFLKGYIDFG